MTTSPKPRELADEVATFVGNLNHTLSRALPNIGRDLFRTQADKRDRHITVRQRPVEGFPLSVDKRPAFNLKVSYRCMWSSERRFLSVGECDFTVLFAGLTEPLLRYHFVREPSGGLPSAHLHVHAHGDEVVAAMLGGADKGRVRARLADIQQGGYPRLESLHLPMGGPRFRPSIEDLLEILQLEFQIDVLGTFDSAVLEGRRIYRQMQLMAAVADDPLATAAELERIGYVISAPHGEPPLREPRF